MQALNHIHCNNFWLEQLPKDIMIEIFSFLEKEDLGRLACLSKTWSNDEMSNIMWTNLVATCLPEKFQKLPIALLKEKFKAYLDSLKEQRISDILENHNNYKTWNRYGKHVPIFSKALLYKLNGHSHINEKTAAIKSELNGPALYFISNYCHTDVKLAEADIFLRLGANPNFSVNNNTLLHNACSRGFSDLAKKLIEYGADVILKDNEGYTPLQRLSTEYLTPAQIEEIKQFAAMRTE